MPVHPTECKDAFPPNLGVKLPAPVGVLRLGARQDRDDSSALSLFRAGRGSLRLGR
jgi:hypothetical protein